MLTLGSELSPELVESWVNVYCSTRVAHVKDQAPWLTGNGQSLSHLDQAQIVQSFLLAQMWLFMEEWSVHAKTITAQLRLPHPGSFQLDTAPLETHPTTKTIKLPTPQLHAVHIKHAEVLVCSGSWYHSIRVCHSPPVPNFSGYMSILFSLPPYP